MPRYAPMLVLCLGLVDSLFSVSDNESKEPNQSSALVSAARPLEGGHFNPREHR